MRLALLLVLLVGCQERPEVEGVVEYKAPPTPEPAPPTPGPFIKEGFWTKELWYDEKSIDRGDLPMSRQVLYVDHGPNGSLIHVRTYDNPGQKHGEWANEGLTCFTINGHDPRWYCRKGHPNEMVEADLLEGDVELETCASDLTSVWVNGKEVEACFYEGCDIGLTFEDRVADLDLVGEWVRGNGDFKP